MRIEYIKLRNYRQYQDEKITLFQPNGEKNFTIIQGSNGAGKTNILNAITWCLYGKELHTGSKYKGLPIWNIRTMNQLKPDEECKVEVELQFLDNDNKKIIINRSLRFKKLNNADVKTIPEISSNYPDGSKIEMIREIDRDMITIQDPRFVINKLIPENIQEYFFFDGEQLNNYFKAASGENIKDAVFKISQIDLLENVIRRLRSKKKDFMKEIAKFSSQKIEDLQERINTYTHSLEKHKEEIARLKKQRKEAEEKEKEYTEKLLSGPDSNVVALERDNRKLKVEIEQLNDEIDRFKKKKKKHLLENAPPILVYKAISETLKFIGESKEAGEIPPDYRRDFIEKLLKEGKCICGTDISTDNEHRRRVEEFLNKSSTLDEISIEAMQSYTTLKNMVEELKYFREEIRELNESISNLESLIKKKSEKFQNNKELIGKTDVEQIRFWQSKRDEYENIKNELTDEISKSTIRAENAEYRLKELEKELKRELEKKEEYKEFSNMLKFLEKSLSAANEIKEQIMDEIRRDIEEKTERQFFELIWKKEDYKDVKIDEDYNISVIHQSGIDGIGTLSAGERQVLALSFMAALNNVSGFDVPIFIDTPLGRISKEPKNKIANNLPNYLKEKQVIMLVTEEEYTPEVRSKLSNRVGREYRIVFNETTDGNYAEVIQYGE